MSIWVKLRKLDRRYIFLPMFLSLCIPLLFHIGLPVKITEDVRDVWKYIESLNEGDVVLISYDHDTGTLPEMVPMSDALLRHIFSKNLKVVQENPSSLNSLTFKKSMSKAI